MDGRRTQTHCRRWSRWARIAGLIGCGLWLVRCASATSTPTSPTQPDVPGVITVTPPAEATPSADPTLSPTPSPTLRPEGYRLADVRSADVSGAPDAYSFAVGVSSPDTGCGQYADWWEIISEEGELLYRRILLHSHVNEQPFVRSGGPIAVSVDTIVIVRAHMAPGGYGGSILRGSAGGGFLEMPGDPRFAAELAEVGPLPESCAF